MLSRFFYNSSSMACETFLYGGCLGNGNNFYSEKECLQACRTEGENPGWAGALQVPLLRHHKGSEHCLKCHVSASMWEVWGSLDPQLTQLLSLQLPADCPLSRVPARHR